MSTRPEIQAAGYCLTQGDPISTPYPIERHGALDHHTGSEHPGDHPVVSRRVRSPQACKARARPRLPGPADPQKRSRNASRTKAEILSAARDEFCEQGFNGARVDLIAARAQRKQAVALLLREQAAAARRCCPARRLSVEPAGASASCRPPSTN